MASESVPTNGNETATPEFMAAQDFSQLLTDDEMQKLEDVAQSYGISRRMASALLSRSKAFLMDNSKDDPSGSVELYLDMAERMQDYKEHLKNQLEQAEVAEARALVMAASLGQLADGA